MRDLIQIVETAGRKIPPRLYHVVGDNWRPGQPLQSLYRQHGNDSYERFGQRWPDAADFAEYHAHLIFFYDNSRDAEEHAASLGGRVVQVDPDQIDLRWDDLEAPGYWVTPYDVPGTAVRLVDNAQAEMLSEALTRISRVTNWAELKRKCDQTIEGKLRCVFVPGEGAIVADAYNETHYSIENIAGIDPATPGLVHFIIVNREKFPVDTNHYLPFDGPYAVLYYGRATDQFARLLDTTPARLRDLRAEEEARRGGRGARLSPRMEPR
jgi:hypothetical protein